MYIYEIELFNGEYRETIQCRFSSMCSAESWVSDEYPDGYLISIVAV
jgi:hypothetical protein